MKSIRLYNTTADYTADIANLPFVNVAKTKDDGKIHYMGMKEVQDHFITEEEYGSAAFNVFRAQGWINQDATYMTRLQAASITNLNNAFLNNTEIEDATFLQYFTSLTQFPDVVGFTVGGFNGCSSLKKVIIPNVTIYNGIAFRACPLEYIEFSEGITTIPNQFCPNSDTTKGTSFVLPSTLTSIGNDNFNYCGLKIVDLRNTSIVTIGNNFIRYPLNCKKIYFPESLTSIGIDLAQKAGKIEYIEFNSTTSLSIGKDSYARDNYATYPAAVINFKNNIPITIGEAFGAYNKNKCVVIFHSTTAPTIEQYFFGSTKTSTEIYVPEGCVSVYEGISTLSDFVGRIYEIGGTEWTAAGLDQYE